MLPQAVVDLLSAELGGPIRAVTAVGGGCIANACRIETTDARYFLKWGDAAVGRTFEAEAYGLSLLRLAADTLVVPGVIAVRGPEGGVPGILLLEWVEQGRRGTAFWEDFGRGLAGLHRTALERFGADRDNFIGRLPQNNQWMDAWPEFFRTRRLEPQVRMARDGGHWPRHWDPLLGRLYARLEELLPAKPEASVLHGDLWGGNFMVTSTGKAALIDPAAYHGHRETDLAMTELFGGFDPLFYAAYREAWPLEEGYWERKEVYNLYHLINHLNHFGSGYARPVESILEAYA